VNITTGAPIAATATWQTVISAAGRRCTCSGACRRSHARTGGCCAAEAPRVRLYAAPADPSIPATRADRVAVADLSAWCGPCLDAARRRHTPPPAPEPETDALFDLPDLKESA
jgi:hypothetical protein